MDSKQDLLIASGPNYGPSQTVGGVSDRPKVDYKGTHSYNTKSCPTLSSASRASIVPLDVVLITWRLEPAGPTTPMTLGWRHVLCPGEAELRPLLPKAPPSWERRAGEKVKLMGPGIFRLTES